MAAAVFAFSQSTRNVASRRSSPASMTMRQSFGGSLMRISTALAKLLLPARIRMARRPPNSGTVIASSIKPRWLGGKLVAVEPHQGEWIVHIVDSAGDQRIGALAHEAQIVAQRPE